MADADPGTLADPSTLARPGTQSGSLRSWTELERAAAGCTDCALHEGRTKVVFGEGPPQADLMFVGEAPGRHDDLQGKPFLGAVGNLLTNMLAEVGLNRADVYLTNLVKCTPLGNRGPLAEEVDACSGFLREQIAHVQPRVVVTLGEFAMRALLRRSAPLDKVAGYRFDLHGITVVPSLHPVEVLRGNNLAMTAIRRDIRTAQAVLEGRLSTGAEALAQVLASRGPAQE